MFRLKLELLCYGFALSPSARAALPSFRSGAATVRDYPTTSGLIVRLPGDTWVNARLQVHDARYVLDHDDVEGFHVLGGADAVPVDVFPPSAYALRNHKLPTGKSARVAANTHADRVRLTPIHGCGLECRYCSYPDMSYRPNTVDEMTAALTMALSDSIVDPPHVLVSGGSPKPEEGEYRYMNEMYRELPARFPGVRFDVMLTPRTLHVGPVTRRRYANLARFLKHECGYDAISVNLEFNSSEVLREYAREKADIGRENYLRFMECAVDEFGAGVVRSVLIVGIEDDDETLAAVDALSSRGVLAELSAFHAFSGTAMETFPEPSPQRLERVYERARVIAERNGTPLGYFCIPCSHNIL